MAKSIKHVYMCYTHKDDDIVDTFKQDLIGNGFSILNAHESLEAHSKQWEDAIKKEIQSADAFVYIASPEAKASQECIYELGIAQNRPIISFWIKGDSLIEAFPIDIYGAEPIDARQDYEEALAVLLRKIDADIASSVRWYDIYLPIGVAITSFAGGFIGQIFGYSFDKNSTAGNIIGILIGGMLTAIFGMKVGKRGIGGVIGAGIGVVAIVVYWNDNALLEGTVVGYYCFLGLTAELITRLMAGQKMLKPTRSQNYGFFQRLSSIFGFWIPIFLGTFIFSVYYGFIDGNGNPANTKIFIILIALIIASLLSFVLPEQKWDSFLNSLGSGDNKPQNQLEITGWKQGFNRGSLIGTSIGTIGTIIGIFLGDYTKNLDVVFEGIYGGFVGFVAGSLIGIIGGIVGRSVGNTNDHINGGVIGAFIGTLVDIITSNLITGNIPLFQGFLGDAMYLAVILLCGFIGAALGPAIGSFFRNSTQQQWSSEKLR